MKSPQTHRATMSADPSIGARDTARPPRVNASHVAIVMYGARAQRGPTRGPVTVCAMTRWSSRHVRRTAILNSKYTYDTSPVEQLPTVRVSTIIEGLYHSAIDKLHSNSATPPFSTTSINRRPRVIDFPGAASFSADGTPHAHIAKSIGHGRITQIPEHFDLPPPSTG